MTQQWSQQASDGFHETCIMSPSLYTGGTPLVTNFPMSKHSSQLVAIGQSLPLLPQKLVQQIQVGKIVDFGELPSAKRKTASSAHNVHLPDSTCTVTGSTPTQKANTGLQHMVQMLCYLHGSYGNSPTTLHPRTDGIPN